MRVVPLSQLTPGMISAQDILSNDKRFMLKKGTPLTDELITRLAVYGVLSIAVENDTVAPAPIPLPIQENHVRSTPEFQVFQQIYTIEIDAMKANLNAVITRNAPLNVDALLNNALNIIESAKGRLSLFDMLHNMLVFDD